jgi:hypothetical protein
LQSLIPQGDILDDDVLVQSLEETKDTVKDIQLRSLQALETQAENNNAREIYRLQNASKQWGLTLVAPLLSAHRFFFKL